MRAGLPKKEPELLKRWADMDLFERLRAESKGRPEVRAARRPALRQRQHPHRPCAQQDPQGLRDPLAADAGLRRRLRARLGLPRPADRMEDRGGVPRQGPEQGRGAGRPSSAASAAPSPTTGSTCSARSSSAWACSATGTTTTRPWTTQSEAAIVARARQVPDERRALPRLQAGAVVVVEKTALADAEVEYHDHTSDTIYVRFPV